MLMVNEQSSTIATFAPGAQGNVAPTTTIARSLTLLTNPTSVGLH